MKYTSPVHGRARTIPVKYFAARDLALVNDIRNAPDGSNLSNGLVGFSLYFNSSGQGLPPDSIRRFENLRSPASATPLEGSTSVHAQASIIDTADFGVFNSLRWRAASNDGYRKESSRICCAAGPASLNGFTFVGGVGFLGGSIGSITYGINIDQSDDLGGGVYVDALAYRTGVALCGKLNGLTLQSPFVLLSTGPVMQPLPGIHTVSSQAKTFTYDPYQPSTIFNGFIAYPYALYESCIEVVGAQANGPQRILLAFGPGEQRSVVCLRKSDSKFFATLLSGNIRSVIPAWPQVNYDPSPTVLRPPTPFGVGTWQQNKVSASFVRFECNSLEIPEPLASRGDVARIPSEGLRLLCGGIQNTSTSAMVGDESAFDFAETTTIPFISDSIQLRTIDFNAVAFLPGDQAFDNPQHLFVNSPSVLSVGHKLSRLATHERTPNTDTATYRKHGPTDAGTLTEESVVAVSLRSAMILSPQPPLSDDAICFPVMKPSDQTVFRFRGKQITGTKISFAPWSSNTFTQPIRSFGATQLEQPSYGLASVSVTNFTEFFTNSGPGTEAGQVPQGKDPLVLSGTYLVPSDGLATEYQEVETPANYLFRKYNTTEHFLPGANPGYHPPLAAMYGPNQAYDELAFMAGALSEACPSRFVSGYYSVGRIETPSHNVFGWKPEQVIDNHPAAWPTTNSAGFGVPPKRVPIRSLTHIGFLTFEEATQNFMPSISGKEYECTSKTLFGAPLQAGLFHCLSEGNEKTKTATINFKGLRVQTTRTVTTAQLPGQPNFSTLHTVTTREEFAWDGKVDHACTFRAPVVEIYVRWSASLQSPGQYKVRRPLPEYVNYDGLPTASSVIAPQMFCRPEDVASVTPILIADVWVRAIGECDVSSTYEFPEVFGTSGTYTHKTNVQGSDDLEDLPDTSFGHARQWASGELQRNNVWPKNESLPTETKAMRYLGAFPFNRAQTQQLLDGQEVEPTYWFLDDEGTAFESQPVTVPWHNQTFGTYKLKVQLVTA